MLYLYFELCEYQDGIDYYNKYYTERTDEVKLYILLKHICSYDLHELWLSEYEKALANNVNTRDGLRKVYEFVKKNDRFPEVYY